MRACVTVAAASSLLAGCVGWTGTSAPKSDDGDRFTAYVDTRPAVFLAVIPAMALPMSYTVNDCFRETSTVKEVPGLVFGADPLDVVCRQYPGVDLRDYAPSTAACFIPDDNNPNVPVPKYLHPWLGSASSPECTALIADIERAKRAH